MECAVYIAALDEGQGIGRDKRKVYVCSKKVS